MNLLELRLNHLSSIVATSSQSNSPPLLALLSQVQEGLSNSVSTNEQISKFYNLYSQLEPLLTSSNNQLLIDDLHTDSKRELALASEDYLLAYAENLSEIDQLQSELDNPILESFPTHIPTFAKLESNVDSSHRDLIDNRRKFLNVIDTYDGMVEVTSRLFTLYHETLTNLEDEVARLEKIKKERDDN